MRTRKSAMCSLLLLVLPTLTLAEANRLLDTLRYETNLTAIYNEISQIEWSPSNLKLLQALWNEEVEKFPDLPWGRLKTEFVKLALANVLMQAHRHCRLKTDMAKLHDFVKSRTVSHDAQVRGRATLLLGLSGYEEDIPYLVSVVESERDGSAEEAALSLTFIHTEAAVNAIRALEEKVRRPTLKRFLHELTKKYQTPSIVEFSKSCEQLPN